MPGWDDRWQKFPASKPLEAKGGIATSKARARWPRRGGRNALSPCSIRTVSGAE